VPISQTVTSLCCKEEETLSDKTGEADTNDYIKLSTTFEDAETQKPSIYILIS
jgi:hypothetical protein